MTFEANYGMAEAYENAGVPWVEVVESLVEHMLKAVAESGELPDPVRILPKIHARHDAGRNHPKSPVTSCASKHSIRASAMPLTSCRAPGAGRRGPAHGESDSPHREVP